MGIANNWAEVVRMGIRNFIGLLVGAEVFQLLQLQQGGWLVVIMFILCNQNRQWFLTYRSLLPNNRQYLLVVGNYSICYINIPTPNGCQIVMESPRQAIISGF